MTYRRQLIAGYTTLLVVTLVTGVAAVIALRTVSDRFESVARDLAGDVFAVQRLQFEAEQVVSTSRGYLLTGDRRARARFAEASIVLQTSLALLQLRTDLADDIERVEAVARAYATTAAEAAEIRTMDARTITSFFESTLLRARERFATELEEFVAREQARFQNASLRARRFATRTQILVILATVLGIGASMFLAWVSIRRLSAQYARELAATSAAQRAAAARDEMLAVVSHDLRNPLSAITMGTTLLEETLTEPRARKHVAVIGNAAARMRHLIDELLDVAKLESGTFVLNVEPCDAAALLDATVSLFQARAAEAHVSLVIEPFEGVTLVADRERVLQVLSNLVGNAFKFTPRDGRIALAVRDLGASVQFRVSDTGRGIAEEHVPHLFDRYWQGRVRGRGSLGLGLYICKQLVEAHHGQIEVESAPGRGSTFSFTLPRA